MFPWGNTENPLESLFKKPSFHLYDHPNPNTPSFCNFPSPFLDEHELPLHQILPPDPSAKGFSTSENSPVSSKLKGKATSSKQPIATSHAARRRSLGVVPRKRSAGKKDRHSKICTAQGVRDRRMRLSLQVARKFFDLQDMLGYDKASKTIEWLFTKSKKAIKDLIKEKNKTNINNYNAKSESFVSECEELSGIEETSNDGASKPVPNSAKPRKTGGKPNLRESREKARARARCRTREKMMIKGLEGSGSGSGSGSGGNAGKLGLGESPFDQESGPVSPYDADVGTIEKLLGNCMDPDNNFMGFLGNWDLLNNGRMNPSHYYAVTNQIAGNTSSIFSDSTPDLPLFDHQ